MVMMMMMIMIPAQGLSFLETQLFQRRYDPATDDSVRPGLRAD